MFALSITEADRESRGKKNLKSVKTMEVERDGKEENNWGGFGCLSKQVAALRLTRVPGWLERFLFGQR